MINKNFKIGDKVKVVKKAERLAYSWISDYMDNMICDNIYEIEDIDVHPIYNFTYYKLKNFCWWFLEESLLNVNLEIKIKLLEKYL